MYTGVARLDPAKDSITILSAVLWKNREIDNKQYDELLSKMAVCLVLLLYCVYLVNWPLGQKEALSLACRGETSVTKNCSEFCS